ncbi:MAG: GNAT family N-acetyltransferase [Bacteroidales bacterium]|jgi:ribosomal protein S18 acetylase RimI-like enzyme|nr:GNAT family N-acetyltransferase [Bacteroidales bacterium]
MIIRDYREGDYQALSELWLDTGVGRPDRGDDNETILRSVRIGGKMLIMEDDNGELTGSSWMTYDGRRIHLHHFAILPSHQGKGLAIPLLKESLNFVKEKGSQVKLEVHRSNLKAINLYEKAGFRYLGDYDVYIIRDIDSL